MMQLYNKTIKAIALDTPSGCMGECPWFHMRVECSGALEYNGIANMPQIGEHKGCINYYEFDSVASVVETSGFLDMPDEADDGSVSTGGDLIIEIERNDGGKRVFVRDAFSTPPLMWAIEKLMTLLLEKVTWGEAAYAKSIKTFEARR